MRLLMHIDKITSVVNKLKIMSMQQQSRILSRKTEKLNTNTLNATGYNTIKRNNDMMSLQVGIQNVKENNVYGIKKVISP